jgi:type IV secretory pathway VirD2 relaxase
MPRTDDDREFRLRPPKPRVARNDGAAWSNGFKLLMHYARSSRKTGNRAPGGKGKAPRPYHQRCAVRVTYLKNKVRGQWRAHGRYLARESAVPATPDNDAKAVGFNQESSGIDIARQLENWQGTSDERLWKIIVSPEFGDRIDLSRLTRDLVRQMEKDLGTELEWVAVEHHNTEHPHVHVAVRGIRSDRESLRLSRDYVKHGIRSLAGDLCTRQLGYRTELDAIESERREITETRFTSIDRRFLSDASDIRSDLGPHYFAVSRNPVQTDLSESARVRTQHEASRLSVLGRMGLAESTGPNSWRVRRDFDQILKAMQRTNDRQKTLAAHGVVMSDNRLAIEVLDVAKMTTVEGRVLVHGQDEQSGRNYLMLEGTDAKVYLINYTPEMEMARSRGELRTNSFVRLRKLSIGQSAIDVDDLGDAERLLSDPRFLGTAARQLLMRGIIPAEEGWGGWLGRYQAALQKATSEIEEPRERNVLPRKQRGRNRDRSLGR